jgi:hypothetical protein
VTFGGENVNVRDDPRERQRALTARLSRANPYDSASTSGGNYMKFQLFDFRGVGDPNLSEDERKAWQAEFLEAENGVEIALIAPDGSTRTVRVEIDQGDLRVWLWPDVSVSDGPAAQILLRPGSPTATLEPVEQR